MNSERIDRLRTQMKERGIDIAVYGCDAGYQYLSGVINGWRFRCATSQQEGGPPLQRDFELTQTHVVADLGISIDYPEGWFAETRNTVTAIYELEDELRVAFGPLNDGFPSPILWVERNVDGYGVGFDHRDLPHMRSAGLPFRATLDDLLEFNVRDFGGQVKDVLQTEIFGVPALSMKGTSKFGDEEIMYMGFIEDEASVSSSSSFAFLFRLLAPSEDALDEFMPTWEAMIASIKSVEE